MTNEALKKALNSGAIVLEGQKEFSGTQLIVLNGKAIGFLHDKAVVDGHIVEEVNGVVTVQKVTA